MDSGRPWWDGSEELRRYREAEAAEARKEEAARWASRQLSGSIIRGFGGQLGRSFARGLLGLFRWR